MILAFDTSSALTSVALVESGAVIATAEHLDARRHAEVTAPLLAQVLGEVPDARMRVRRIACGVGPGPYTGLRVGISTAIAVGLAWEVPVVGLCSLDAVAEQALAGTAEVGGPSGRFAVSIDARRSEAYWAEYDADGARISGPLVTKLVELDVLMAREPGLNMVGPADTYPHAMWVARRVERLLTAGVELSDVYVELDAHGADGSATARALAGAALLPPSPLYLRRPDAMEPAR